MIRFLFILSCISLSLLNVTAVHAQQVFKTTSKTVIGYLEYLPDGYKSSSNDYPVVIFLHGRGEKGPNSNDPRILASGKSLLEKIGPPRHVKDGTKFPFILISPQLKQGYSGWPTAYVMEVLEHVQRTLRIDKSRIYITGLSMGGFGTWAMIQQYPGLFAAAAPICGGGNPRMAGAIANEDLPVWAFHGDADNVVHVNKSIEMVDAINRHNPSPRAKLSIYRGVKHDAWVRAYRPDHAHHNPNVYEWLMSHRNGKPSQPEPANVAPVANAGADKKIGESDGDVVIAGSGTDKDGTIKAYAWSKVSGGSVDMDDTNKKDLIISGYSEGSYVFKLTVTDDKGATHSDEVKITVESSHTPPVADAGADVSIELPQNSVTLKGKASLKDGKISSVSWTQTEGDAVRVSGENSLELKLEELTAGEYKFRLTVRSDNGLSDTDDVTVVVKKPSNIQPVANAGADVVAKASDEKVVIKGSGRDEDGTITKYEWKKVSGGSADLTNTNTAELTVSNFAEGSYVFQLIVTDNKGATDTDDVKLTVEAPEYKAPVANAGPDHEIELPENSVVLKGSGRSEDGKITSFTWKQTAGEPAELAGQNTAELSVSELKAGDYKFELTVKTDKGLSDSDEVLVKVKTPSNIQPIANAGADVVTKASDEKVIIKGSGRDEDGTITKYEWKKISGGSADLTNTNTAELTVSNFAEGSYVFQLIVTDNKGATDTDDVKLTVEAPEYKAPIANAGPDHEIELPENSVVLKGSGRVEDGKITSFTWKQTAGDPAELADQNTAELLVGELKAGDYKFELTVKTDKGLSDSDEVLVKVKTPSNIQPIANAGADVVAKASDEKVVIKGSGRDEDGTITKYEWKKISGGSVDLANTNAAELTVSDFAEGSYVFQLTVTDNKGATDTDDVKLEVNAPEYKAPIANAGPDHEIELPKNSVVLKGSGRAEDGKIISYEWKQTAGEAAQLTGENAAELSVKGLEAGEYEFRLTVKTDKGLSDSDDVIVLVKRPSNVAPIANAGPDITIKESDKQEVLSGSGKDEDGTITTYQWTKVSGGVLNLNNPDKADLTISDFREGTYVMRLTVTDDKGAKASDDVKVIVEAPDYAAPVANAGPDQQIQLPANSIVLKGSATADDGKVTSYLWSQKSGDDVELSGAETPTLTINKLTVGEYVFKLTVQADNGLSDSDEVTVKVEEASNIKPVADAGVDITISVDDEVYVLEGAGSDEDGTITSYSWNKLSGGAVDVGNENQSDITISNFEAGTYVFSLTVVDDKGARDSDEVEITVEPSQSRGMNNAPVADAGEDRTVSGDAVSFVLLGFGEDDDGEIVSYNWKQVSGEATVTLADANTAGATVTDFENGTYVFRLTVTDDQGAKGYDDITVVVENKPGELKVYAGNDRTIQLPQNEIVLKGGASVDKGIITDYKWSMVSGGFATLSGENSQTLTAGDLEEGAYVFRLTATADNGLSAYDDIKITVRAARNTPPVANAGPDHDIEYDLGSFVIIGSAEDKEGPIAAYSWRKISGGTVALAGQDTGSLTITSFEPGKYVFQLTVTDEHGKSDSDDVIIIVNEPSTPDSRPVAYAGNDRVIRLPINSVTLRGGAKAEGRTIVSYQWEQVAGPHAKLSGMDTQTMTAEQLGIGRYTFRLKATCDLGFSAYDDINITVKESLFPVATIDRSNAEINNGRAVERDFDLEADKLASTDLTAGAVPDLENYAVAVFNDRGDKIFHGKWGEDSFEQVFQRPGFYVYHVLDGRHKVKIGKLVIQP